MQLKLVFAFPLSVCIAALEFATAQELPSRETNANQAFEQWRSMSTGGQTAQTSSPLFQQQIEQRPNAKVLAGDPKLSEWLRDPQNAALAKASALERAREDREQTLNAIAIGIIIFGMAIWPLRLIWRRRCRLAQLIEDAIVLAGAGLLRAHRAVQSGATRVRNRIFERAE